MYRKTSPFRKSAALFLFLVFGVLKQSGAQSTLVAGDIAFTGYNASPYGNSFSFVLLTNISGGTSISFTDIGWNPLTYSLSSLGADGVFTWTSTTAMPRGTEVTIAVATAGTSITSVSAGSASTPYGGTGSGYGFVLSTAGDQILAYQGTQSSPTFIAGIQCNAEMINAASTASTLTGWDDIEYAGWSYSTNRSAIPPGLTNGTNAVMVVTGSAGSYTEWDAVKYNCTGSAGASTAAIAANVNNLANWSVNNTGVTLPAGCTFAVVPAPAITGQPAGSSVCAGGNATFSVTATNASGGYQWQENGGSGFTNITNGGIYSGATGATLTLTGVTAAMNGYTYRAMAIGSATVTSNAATLSVTSPGTWLGGASTAWSNTANWSCGALPTSTTNVTIPTGTTYSPLVDITTAAAKNITIASGAGLAFTGTGNVLSIYGTLTNTVTFSPAGGKTVFAGASQSIPALTYNSLQVTGGGSKTLAGAVTVNGTLALSNGYLLPGNNDLTIGSSGNITGAGINSFIVVNGTGGLVQNNIGAGGRTGNISFPVGVSSSSFTPVFLNNTTGTADNFKARVINNVYTAYDAGDNPTGSVLTSKVVDRTWLITEGTAGGSNATVTVEWSSGDELSGFDNNNCALSHYYGGGWHNGAAPAVAAGSDPYTMSVSGVNSFSPFAVGSTGGPLPLHLLSFSGRRTGNDVILDWLTADEHNVQGFVVERSADGAAFTALDTTGPNNSAAQTNAYSFTDKAAAGTATLYYRLKMPDFNGSSAYSNTIRIAGGSNITATPYDVYPNPAAGDQIFIRTTDAVNGDLHILVRDMAGRKLYSTTIAAAEAAKGIVSVDVKLPAGTFTMQLNDGHVSQQVRIVRL